MQSDIAGALRDLTKVAARIAELREWQRLSQQELARRPALLIPNSDQQEIDTLCGSFMILALSVQEALDRSDLVYSPEQKKRWHARLRELKETVALLGFR